MALLSIIMPVYNEAHTVGEALHRGMQQALPSGVEREFIVVDDGSRDGTRAVLASLPNSCTLLTHEMNRGKGAAVRTGITAAHGDIILIYDADLEYEPHDWPKLLQPILHGEADVVYGSRFLSGTHRVLYFWHSVGNKLVTLWSNMWTNLNLTDMETGAKVFTRRAIEGINFRARRFGFEPEFTARMAHRGLRIYEVAVSYHGRSYWEGKKITWRDGFAALWHVVRWNASALAIARVSKRAASKSSPSPFQDARDPRSD
ncbi:MAG: glycosyltransferase family 2 protein [Patescibacteria group bacterium]